MPEVKSVSVRISTDGYEDAKLKIDRLAVAADELKRENPTITPKIDAAKALIEAKLLKDGIRKELSGSVMASGGGGGGKGFLSSLFGSNESGGASGITGSGLGGLASGGLTSPLAIGGIAAAVAAALPEMAALVSGLTAATVGAGAFGAVALPTFQKLTGDISAVHNANESFQESAANVDTAIRHSAADATAYNAALAKMPPNLASAAKLLGDQNARWQDLSKAQQNNVTALANNKAAMASLLPSQKTALSALLQAKTAWDDMNPAQQKAATSLNQLSNAYQKIVTALQPDVFKVLNAGLKVANQLLPALQPLATAAAGAIDGLLGKLSKFVGSSGFKDWLKQFTALAGPSLTAIGTGIGQIAVAIGKLLTGMSVKDVVHGIAIAFDILAGAINAVTGTVHFLMTAWNYLSAEVPKEGATILKFFSFVLSGVQFFTDHVLGAFKALIDGAAKLAGWVPGFGSGLKTAAKYFDGFYNSVHNNLGTAQKNLNQWSQDLTNAPKIFHLKGDITDLQAKLATAEKKLADPLLTEDRKAVIIANISNLMAGISTAKAEIASLQGKTVYITTAFNTIGRPTGMPRAPGSASGGPASGLRLVGETGPELVTLPQGSYVHNAAQTKSMMGNHYTININALVADANTGRRVVEAIRQFETGSGKSWRAS